MKCGEWLLPISGKSVRVSDGEIISTDRGLRTSISEKLVSFYAKVSREYEKCAKALREVSME